MLLILGMIGWFHYRSTLVCFQMVVLCAAVVTSVLLSVLVSCDDSDVKPLTIDPFRWTTEVGTEAVFSCTFYDPSTPVILSWFYPDNVTEVMRELNASSRVYVDIDFNLHVTDVRENDTGLYLCSVTVVSNSTLPDEIPLSSTTMVMVGENVSDFTKTSILVSTEVAVNTSEGEVLGHSAAESLLLYNETVYLKVYTMPSYFTEGMIILGINLGLLLIFVICLVQSFVAEKKRVQLYHKG